MDNTSTINDACQLINEALVKFREAQALFRICGIELCDYLCSNKIARYDDELSNVVIFAGINRLEELTGTKAVFPSGDLSRKRVMHNDIAFVQLGVARKSEYVFR